MSKIISTIVLVLFSCSFMFAQTIRKMDEWTFETIDNKIQTQFNANGLTGLAVGVIYGGELVYAKGYGVRNESNAPFTIYTKSLWASISKTVTGVMTMKMVEDGHLDLDDPIENYLSAYEDSGITIRHLLTHQSGIDHYNTCPDGYNGPFNSTASYLNILSCQICMTPPGSATLYTTQGITILGVILDIIAMSEYNSTYVGLFNQWIKNHSNMTSAAAGWTSNTSGLAIGYDEEGDVIDNDFEDIGWKLPAGGFISDVIDLAKYAEGLLKNEYVTPNSSTAMWTRDQPDGGAIFMCNSADNTPYGLSFIVNGQPGTNLAVRHDGLNPHGYSSHLYLWPNQQAGVVMLANNYDQTDVLSNIRQLITNDILCPTNRFFESGINWNVPKIYEAQNQIVLESTLQSYGGFATFDALNRVLLKPGFSTMPGVKFMTVVGEGCGGETTPY